MSDSEGQRVVGVPAILGSVFSPNYYDNITPLAGTAHTKPLTTSP